MRHALLKREPIPAEGVSLLTAFTRTAIKAGWSAKKVASRLGHNSTAITLDRYVEDTAGWQEVREL